MRTPNHFTMSKELTRLMKRVDYYSKRLEAGKISNDEYLQKIRPVTRSIDIYSTMMSIYNSENDLKRLRESYFLLHQLGTPEEFYIKQLNSGQITSTIETEMNNYENLCLEVKVQIVNQLNNFNHSIKKIQLDDFFQKIIDETKLDDND